MSTSHDPNGYDASILCCDQDDEPYGHAVSPRLAVVTESAAGSRFGPFEREIEAAVLRRLDTRADG
jgi:hypothetical protein